MTFANMIHPPPLDAWRQALPALLPPLQVRVLPEMSPDVRVLGFSIILAFVTTLIFALIPALHASRIDLVTLLNESAVPGRAESGIAARPWRGPPRYGHRHSVGTDDKLLHAQRPLRSKPGRSNGGVGDGPPADRGCPAGRQYSGPPRYPSRSHDGPAPAMIKDPGAEMVGWGA